MTLLSFYCSKDTQMLCPSFLYSYILQLFSHSLYLLIVSSQCKICLSIYLFLFINKDAGHWLPNTQPISQLCSVSKVLCTDMYLISSHVPLRTTRYLSGVFKKVNPGRCFWLYVQIDFIQSVAPVFAYQIE